MRSSLRSTQTAAWAGLFILAIGCADRATVERPGPEVASSPRGPGPEAAPSPLQEEDQALYQKLESQLNTVINDETLRYASLQYRYTENLLEILDQIDRSLSGKDQGERPRFLPKLDARAELDHFRETVRRWEAKTGKQIRVEIDALKADVAARKPGERFHPEFQRKFSQVFDDFIALEVAELRERRNRAIHAAADKLLDPYRQKNPEVVRRLQLILDTPPYDLPPPTGPGSSQPPQPPPKAKT
jgi:hypothetical protein